MVMYRLYFVGTLLLFLSHAANSFILLTANMEDVKKIARKFVSDSLAEKIAEFVAKATEQIVNVSEENGLDVDTIQDFSNEDQLQNIARERHETKTKMNKEVTYVDKKEHTKYWEFNKEYDKEKTTTKVDKKSKNGQVINWEKEVNEMIYDNKSKEDTNAVEHPEDNDKENIGSKDYVQTQDYEQGKLDAKQLDYDEQNRDAMQELSKKPKSDSIKTKFDNEWPKVQYEQNLDRVEHENEKHSIHDENTPNYQQVEKKSIYEPVRKPKAQSNQKTIKERIPSFTDNANQFIPSTIRPTIHYTVLNHKVLRNGPPSRPIHRGHRLTGIDSKESLNSKPGLQAFNIGSLTTKKEKTEFDQYDNPNYSRAEFIATSGPVALPKVNMMKPWWEKEMVT